MSPFLDWLRGSIVRQYTLVFGTITALLMLVALPALIVSLEISSSGGAINVSGSLRWQSYQLAFTVVNPYGDNEVRARAIRSHADEFERRLMSRSIEDSLPAEAGAPLSREYRDLKERWRHQMRPLAVESLESDIVRRRFVDLVPDFVGEVDRFVNGLEARLNARLLMLQILMMLILVGAAVVTVATLFWLKRGVFAPLLEIERAANRVRGGDFAVRIDSGSPNEIGRLASAFDFMVEELDRLYGNLEEEVERKTAQLNKYNRGLHWVGRVNEFLGESETPDWKAFSALLTEGAREMEVPGLALVIVEHAGETLLGASEGYEAAPGRIHEHPFKSGAGASAHRSYRLDVKGFGEPEPWVAEIVTVLVQALGRNFDRMGRLFDDRRLAVLEERNVIARELHDSIAQSLTYCRMQMHRLKVYIARGAEPDVVEKTAATVDEGIRTAYRQLREVLTAFRVHVGSSDLVEAMEETVDAFRNRTGETVQIKADLSGVMLTPNAQVHFVHILSEALSNVEKHAKAKNVLVTLSRRGADTVLEVADDGVGIDASRTPKSGHYGLTIMEERARSMGASLEVLPNPAGRGTLVRLVIPEASGAA